MLASMFPQAINWLLFVVSLNIYIFHHTPLLNYQKSLSKATLHQKAQVEPIKWPRRE